MTGLIVASNRLPVQAPPRGRGPFTRSPGGLAAALHPTLAARGGRWVGWSGGARSAKLPTDLGYGLTPVELDADMVRGYYDGFSNATLWPLYHDRIRPPVHERSWWTSYVAANRRFADTIVAAAPQGGQVWVHDYHLQLVPAMVKERRPDLRIGFYLHIPFPSPDLFMTLPWRSEIIDGIAGADVIGFQTPADAENFVRSEARIAATEAGWPAGRLAHATVGAFPISVDVDQWDRLARSPDIDRRVADLRRQLGDPRHLLLGIDRLDYTKGIEHRLTAFRELLASGELSVPDTVLVQVAVPSRDRTSAYRNEKVRIDQLVGQINGEFGHIGAPAVHYIHRSFTPEEVAVLYRAADVMLVTPLRDGMNLVAKEFVATRVNCRGVLLLSEFAGAAYQMPDAVLVNPYDVESLKRGVLRSLHMPESETRWRMARLRSELRHNTVFHWAEQFLEHLALEAAA